MARMRPPHKGAPKNASQPKLINPVPNHEINSRSPRVVSRPNTPRRGLPPGLNFSHTPMVTMDNTTAMKNAAVGHVQAIQDKPMILLPKPGRGQIPWQYSYVQNR